MKPFLYPEEPHSRGNPIQERRPLSDEIYEALVTELISLRIPPNARMSVDALARQFGVSQTPIRGALIRLETEGLVVKKHNAGYSAAPLPSGKHFEEAYLMRALLEPEAASLAAVNAAHEDVEALKALCDHMEQLVTEDTQGNYGRFAMLDGQFHARITEMCGNELLQHTLQGLYAHMHLFRLRYHSSVAEEAIKEHLAIVEAISRCDSGAARSAMANHIQASRDRMKPYYQHL